MIDGGLAIQGIQNSTGSSNIAEEAFDNVGKGFEDILQQLDKMSAEGGHMSAADTLMFQKSTFEFQMYQETVTKIASKAANSINEVMKAQ